MVALIIGREFAITALRSLAYTKGITIPASPLGKIKMASQVTAILLLILGWGPLPWLAPIFSKHPDFVPTSEMFQVHAGATAFKRYTLKPGVDPLALEHRMWELLDARGAEYPAEHNVGHLYPAKPALAAHYRALDPCNCLNPGIGQTSRQPGWR